MSRDLEVGLVHPLQRVDRQSRMKLIFFIKKLFSIVSLMWVKL